MEFEGCAITHNNYSSVSYINMQANFVYSDKATVTENLPNTTTLQQIIVYGRVL